MTEMIQSINVRVRLCYVSKTRMGDRERFEIKVKSEIATSFRRLRRAEKPRC